MSRQSDARYQAALALARAGKTADARRALEDAHRLDQRHQGIRNALAVLRLEAGDASGAVTLLERLVRESPQVPALQLNYGNALLAAGDLARSIRVLERASKSAPENPLVWYGLGRAQQTSGDPAAAIISYQAVLRLKPDHADARSNLSAAYTFIGKFDTAEAEARQALTLLPSDAGARLNLAIALLSQGKWAEGWAAYEHRMGTRMLDRQRRVWEQPQWQGQDGAGKVLLVHAEQGYGDTIQFVRYLPLVQQRNLRVVLQCPESLVELIGASGLCDEVIAHGQLLPAHDWQVSLLSLPWVLGLNESSDVIGLGKPYLTTSPIPPLTTRPSEDPMRVGLVWAGSSTHVNDKHRSCGFDAMRSLVDLPHVEWWNLQVGPIGNVSHEAIVDRRDLISDFSDTAAMLQKLDAVVSVDSAVAHLAGAIGVPCHLLLPAIGEDWRWRAETSTFRWYAAVQAHRQESPGCWRAPIASVRHAIEHCIWRRAPQSSRDL